MSELPAGPSTPSLQAQNRENRKLVLCFDGTGNTFSGSNADTNVVKLLNKLDRNSPNQFHYYQSKRLPLEGQHVLSIFSRSRYWDIRPQLYLCRPDMDPVLAWLN